jgi:hypothetical protein
MTTRSRTWIAATTAGLVALSLTIGWAGAEHVRMGATGQSSTTTVIVPSPATSTVQTVPAPAQVIVPTPPQTIRADEITANQVRADTIYANRIDADQVVGQVNQMKNVKIGDTKGEIKAPDVAASVIYADEIKANSVTAQQIFVRELRRR